MNIISSVIVEMTPQVDGRFSVQEQHISDDGKYWLFSYVAPTQQFAADALASRAAWLVDNPDTAPTGLMLLRMALHNRLLPLEKRAVWEDLQNPNNWELAFRYQNAVVFDPEDAELKGYLTARFGATRANELLRVP